MPMRPPTHRAPGALTRTEARRQSDKSRAVLLPYRAWYGTTRWKALAQRQLAMHPLCVMCEQEGKVVPARICDHIQPHRGDEILFWNPQNLQSLCRRHHDVDKQRTEVRDAREADR